MWCWNNCSIKSIQKPSKHFSSVVFRNQRSFPYEYIYGETTKPYFVKLWIISYFKCFVCFFFWIYGVHSSKTVLLFFFIIKQKLLLNVVKKKLNFHFLNVVGVLWTSWNTNNVFDTKKMKINKVYKI